MIVESRFALVPPAIAPGRARQRRRRYFLAWLLERCVAVPLTGTVETRASPRER